MLDWVKGRIGLKEAIHNFKLGGFTKGVVGGMLSGEEIVAEGKTTAKQISQKLYNKLIGLLSKKGLATSVGDLKEFVGEGGLEAFRLMADRVKQYNFLFKGKPVATLTGKEFEPNPSISTKDQILEFYNSIGNNAKSVFGKILLDERSVKNNTAH